jgi:predicted MFS family arabinose efflux permease
MVTSSELGILQCLLPIFAKDSNCSTDDSMTVVTMITFGYFLHRPPVATFLGRIPVKIFLHLHSDHSLRMHAR